MSMTMDEFPEDWKAYSIGKIGEPLMCNGEDAYFQDSNIVWLDNDETIVSNLYLYWAKRQACTMRQITGNDIISTKELE